MGRSVSVVWPDTPPRNDKGKREVAEINLRLGFASKRTWAQKLGYDSEEESKEIANERGGPQGLARRKEVDFAVPRAKASE